MGVILPIEAPILEGPRGQNLYCCIAGLGEGEIRPDAGATRPAVPTLPSRAHLQDYGRRTTPSNYILLHVIVGPAPVRQHPQNMFLIVLSTFITKVQVIT